MPAWSCVDGMTVLRSTPLQRGSDAAQIRYTMQTIPLMHTTAASQSPPATAAPPLPAALVLLLATGAGLAVASIYYSQPMLGILQTGMGTSARVIGMVPMLTQLGYALGILLLAPLGDRFDRRRVILMKARPRRP